jgi:transcriptional regulator with XRE-family HTH domain
VNQQDADRCPFAGNKIRILRAQRSWTLKKLADLAGIPLNTAWRLEHGMSPVLTNAIKVAGAFGLTVYEVWNIPGPHITPWVAPATVKSNKLRALRRERQWTLDELAERCRVSKSTIAQIERDRGPTLGNAVRIAAAFGVSVYDIWSFPKAGPDSLMTL